MSKALGRETIAVAKQEKNGKDDGYGERGQKHFKQCGN